MGAINDKTWKESVEERKEFNKLKAKVESLKLLIAACAPYINDSEKGHWLMEEINRSLK